MGAVAAVPLALGAAGFTSAGVAAGSVAAKMMSAAAVANGGGVAAGSLVAGLQSVGKNEQILNGKDSQKLSISVSSGAGARSPGRCSR